MFPIETNAEKPSRAELCSSSARPRAPDCEEKPIRPGGSARGAKVAFSFGFDDAMPRQFGPSRRAPCERTSASSCSCRSRPSAPVSAKPEEITQRARTPLRSASSAASSTRGPGRQMTASSTSSGISAIESYPRTPATGLAAAVDRVGRALEVGLEHVAEELAADRARVDARRRSRPRCAARRTDAARRPRRRGRVPRRAPGSSPSARSGS